LCQQSTNNRNTGRIGRASRKHASVLQSVETRPVPSDLSVQNHPAGSSLCPRPAEVARISSEEQKQQNTRPMPARGDPSAIKRPSTQGRTDEACGCQAGVSEEDTRTTRKQGRSRVGPACSGSASQIEQALTSSRYVPGTRTRSDKPRLGRASASRSRQSVSGKANCSLCSLGKRDNRAKQFVVTSVCNTKRDESKRVETNCRLYYARACWKGREVADHSANERVTHPGTRTASPRFRHRASHHLPRPLFERDRDWD